MNNYDDLLDRLDGIQSQPLPPDEIERVMRTAKKWAYVNFLKKHLGNLEVGKGKRIGPFRSDNEARNLIGYLTNATREMGWGESSQTAHGHRMPTTRSRVHADGDKYWLDIVRMKE